MTKSAAAQQGSALVAVIGITALLTALCLTLWVTSTVRLKAAQRRVLQSQLEWTASSAAQAAAGWFSHAERGSLTVPPRAGDVQLGGRRVDPDDDGRHTLWSATPAPWNVLYKATGGGLFRPPDAGPIDALAGDWFGPDVLVAPPTGTRITDALSDAVSLDRTIRVTEVRVFGPAYGHTEGALGRVSVTVAARRPGGMVVTGSSTVAVRRVDWPRFDDLLVSGSDLVVEGEAGWRWGRAIVGADLVASTDRVASWTGGIPWAAPEQPVRNDLDRDGTTDDLNLNGVGDYEDWQATPGPIRDPWWRLHVAGRWTHDPDASSACRSVFPFGPHRSPPQPASKSPQRSGMFVHCPFATTSTTLADWAALAHAGPRGTHVLEERESLGTFRLRGTTVDRSLVDWLDEIQGLIWIRLSDRRSDPLHVAFEGDQGAVIVTGGDVVARSPRTAGRQSDFSPYPPADTRGLDRIGRDTDEQIGLSPRDSRCDEWDVTGWSRAAASRHRCDVPLASFDGLLVSERSLILEGPIGIRGTIRADRIQLRGVDGEVWVMPTSFDRVDRPAPPHAPVFRIHVID